MTPADEDDLDRPTREALALAPLPVALAAAAALRDGARVSSYSRGRPANQYCAGQGPSVTLADVPPEQTARLAAAGFREGRLIADPRIERWTWEGTEPPP